MEIYKKQFLQHLEIEIKLKDFFKKNRIPFYEGDQFITFLKSENKFDVETNNFKTIFSQLTEDKQYCDLLRVALYFESLFHCSFSIFYFFAQSCEADPTNIILRFYYDSSFNFLIYLCKLGCALVHKIRDFFGKITF